MQCKRMESFKIKKKALKVTRFFLEADKEAFGWNIDKVLQWL